MIKHVFEISGYGWFNHLGEFIKETEKSVTFKYESLMHNRWHEARRIKSKEIIIFETEDPKSMKSQYEEAYRAWSAHVKLAETALSEIKDQQRKAAYKAAFGVEL